MSNNIITNQNIICISSIDWDFIWQIHQEVMSTLADNGNRILFVENTGVRSPTIKDIGRIKKRILSWFKSVKGFRKERENLYIYSPVILPFPYSKVARFINRFILIRTIKRWMNIMDFTEPLIWTFLPTGLTLDILNKLKPKISVYYCIDDFESSSSSAKRIRAFEDKVTEQCDVVFVTAKKLFEHASKFNNNVHLFPTGVNIEKFEKVRNKESTIPEDMTNINHPIVGYIGGIHKWIDENLIASIARALPECSFVFVGPLQTDVSLLKDIPNIRFLGAKDYEELPYYVKIFDVGIIPYKITAYTENVYPVKLNEYLSMGKPVVSTNLPEIIAFNKENDGIVYVANNTEDFISAIKDSLKNNAPHTVEKRIVSARKNTWIKKIEQMSEIIQKKIAEKEAKRER